MKKLFFYAAAALAMLASCQKAEIVKTPSTQIDDSKPVAMQFGVNAPSFQVTKTKAAVNAWAHTDVNVFGLENTTSGYVKLIDNYETTVIDSNTPLEVYQDAATSTPYYYTDNKVYDFFGYHAGGADFEGGAAYDENGNLTGSKVEYTVKFDGSNDVMYATTNKAEDIMKDPTAQVTTKDVYSAWAARRNVQPTLVFEHALTRFNFYIKGMNEKSEKVTIKSISAKSVNKGTLTVVSKNNEDLGFVPSTTVDTTLVLKTATDGDFVETPVVMGETFIAGGDGASLMLAPGMTELPIIVEMINNEHPKVSIPNYEFTAKAEDVRLTGLAENAGLKTFAAKTAYNIYINVYGPEEIVITAELTPWVVGGDYTYDPDANRPDGTPSTYVNAEIEAVGDGTITANISASDDVAALQAALQAKDATEEPTDADYKDVVLTKAQNGTVTFDNLDNSKIYSLVVRYKTDLAYGYTVAENVEVEAPAAETEIASSAYVYNKDTFDAYCSGKLTWFDDSTPASLPWLVVNLNEAKPISHAHIVVTYAYDGKTFKKVFDWAKSEGTIGLVTISGEELGRDITPGTWTIEINGVETEVEVPADFAVTNAWYVFDEKTYNQLPDSYRTKYGQWECDGLEESLPWLAATFTETKNLNVTATCGKYTKNLSFNSETGFTLLTLDDEELGTEIVPGEIWYLTLNNETVKIVTTTITDAWYVCDQESYNKLPASYIEKYGAWGTEGLEESLPWLAVTLAEGILEANWTVSKNGKKVASDTWTKADKTEISLLTFKASELGIDAIEKGDWTIEVNGATTETIKVE